MTEASLFFIHLILFLVFYGDIFIFPNDILIYLNKLHFKFHCNTYGVIRATRLEGTLCIKTILQVTLNLINVLLTFQLIIFAEIYHCEI